MDCSMPEMDGFEATGHLRSIEQEQGRDAAPIVALTAHIAEHIHQQVRQATMNGVVIKPFTIKSIGDCMSKWLEPVEVPGESNEAAEVPKPEGESESNPAEETTFESDAPESPFDGGLLENLKEIAGDGFESTLANLHQLYLDSVPAAFSELEEAVKESEAQRVEHAAHALKSMSMNIAASRLGQACKEMEDAGKAGDKEQFASLFSAIARELGTVLEHLQGEQTGNGKAGARSGSLLETG